MLKLAACFVEKNLTFLVVPPPHLFSFYYFYSNITRNFFEEPQ